MQGSGLRQAFTILAGLALGLATLQFFLAGLGVFAGDSFDAHKIVGNITMVVALLMLIAAAVGRLGRPALIFGGGLFVIILVMSLISGSDTVLGAFHPLLAIAAWFGAFQAFSWGRTGAPLVDSPATAGTH